MIQFLAVLIMTSLLAPASFHFFQLPPITNSFLSSVETQRLAPVRKNNDSLGIAATADSILVLDTASGAVLYRKNETATQSIASITKLMTALVVVSHNPGWDTPVTIQPDDQRPGGIAYLVPGEQVKVKDLLYLMLVASSNQAAYALARATGQADFAAAMNVQAASLGMTQTQFVDPAGLDADNVSTAHDVAVVLQAAINQPDIQKAITTGEYSFTPVGKQQGRTVRSTDQLLNSFLNKNPYQIIGAKTGYLVEAGYCLAIQLHYQTGQPVAVILLGADSPADRWQETKGLITWTLDNYTWPSQ